MSLTFCPSLPPAANVLIPDQSGWTAHRVCNLLEMDKAAASDWVCWPGLLFSPFLPRALLHRRLAFRTGMIFKYKPGSRSLPPSHPCRKTASLSSQEGKSIEIWKQLLLSYPNNRWILCLYCFFKKKVNHGRPQFIIIIITILYLQRHSKLNTNTFCERCLLEKPSGGILRNWNCEFALSTATTGTGNVDRRTEIDRVGEWNEAWERE